MLVTDYRMPGRDGIAVAHKARHYHPLIPVLFVTGTPDMLSKPDIPEPASYLAKPFSPEELLAAVKGVLH